MVWMIFVSNCPALPTNGSPCKSSSAPGASPTNISSASKLPTPNTTFFREAAKDEHFTQAIARCRKLAKPTVFAPGDGTSRMVAGSCSTLGELAGAGATAAIFCGAIGFGGGGTGAARTMRCTGAERPAMAGFDLGDGERLKLAKASGETVTN